MGDKGGQGGKGGKGRKRGNGGMEENGETVLSRVELALPCLTACTLVRGTDMQPPA